MLVFDRELKFAGFLCTLSRPHRLLSQLDCLLLVALLRMRASTARMCACTPTRSPGLRKAVHGRPIAFKVSDDGFSYRCVMSVVDS